MTPSKSTSIPHEADEPAELDYSDADPDFDTLARDRVPVRTLQARDLQAVIAIDRRITGRDRSRYYKLKLGETLEESAVRVSLVAEMDGRPVGFIMARVDYGEFGRTEAEAVIDTIGVAPDYRHHDVGKAMLSQLLTNLRSLQVEGVRTEVDWDDFSLLAFLQTSGFTPAQRIAFQRRVPTG